MNWFGLGRVGFEKEGREPSHAERGWFELMLSFAFSMAVWTCAEAIAAIAGEILRV